MRLYQFNLPEHSNDAQRDYELQRIMWREHAVAVAGGATYIGRATGHWDSGAGRIVKEPMHVYQVACDDYKVAESLVTLALELFADQDAIFWADIGAATITARNNVAKIG